MSHRSKIIKEWVDVLVQDPNRSIKGTMEVDKLACKIIGIALTASVSELLYYRGSQRITINEKEIYPEGYESQMLMQGLNVAVNDRIITFGEDLEPGNRKVELDYKDTDHASSPFLPYRVRLYVFSLLAD